MNKLRQEAPPAWFELNFCRYQSCFSAWLQLTYHMNNLTNSFGLYLDKSSYPDSIHIKQKNIGFIMSFEIRRLIVCLAFIAVFYVSMN